MLSSKKLLSGKQKREMLATKKKNKQVREEAKRKEEEEEEGISLPREKHNRKNKGGNKLGGDDFFDDDFDGDFDNEDDDGAAAEVSANPLVIRDRKYFQKHQAKQFNESEVFVRQDDEIDSEEGGLAVNNLKSFLTKLQLDSAADKRIKQAKKITARKASNNNQVDAPFASDTGFVLPPKPEYDPNRLRSVFDVETKKELEAKKLASRLPLDLSKRSKPELWSDTMCDNETNIVDVIDIPKRPPWNFKMTVEELETQETEYFESYLENIKEKYPAERLNYFEQNLEVWRQLWRVCERSDIVMLVTDARYPLFHFPPALYSYVINELKKPLLLVLNKADIVNPKVLEQWQEFFKKHYPEITTITFSSYSYKEPEDEEAATGQRAAPYAVDANGNIDHNAERKRRIKMMKTKKRLVEAQEAREKFYEVIRSLNVQKKNKEAALAAKLANAADDNNTNNSNDTKNDANADVANASDAEEEDEEDEQETTANDDGFDEPVPVDKVRTEDLFRPEIKVKTKKKGRAKHRPEMVVKREDLYRAVDGTIEEPRKKSKKKRQPNKTDFTIKLGAVGHPNVGKSSLINGLMGKTVVSTSATPGHTKHFQTIFLTEDIELVDCPGLVFPALDKPKPLQILCGLYPISQVREPYTALRYLAERVPLEEVYNLTLPEGFSAWSPWSICEAFAIQKGYITAKRGVPDVHRAGLEILKECLDGKIVISWPPPAKLPVYRFPTTTTTSAAATATATATK